MEIKLPGMDIAFPPVDIKLLPTEIKLPGMDIAFPTVDIKLLPTDIKLPGMDIKLLPTDIEILCMAKKFPPKDGGDNEIILCSAQLSRPYQRKKPFRRMALISVYLL